MPKASLPLRADFRVLNVYLAIGDGYGLQLARHPVQLTWDDERRCYFNSSGPSWTWHGNHSFTAAEAYIYLNRGDRDPVTRIVFGTPATMCVGDTITVDVDSFATTFHIGDMVASDYVIEEMELP